LRRRSSAEKAEVEGAVGEADAAMTGAAVAAIVGNGVGWRTTGAGVAIGGGLTMLRWTIAGATWILLT
jgi:hypothetical protein